MGKSAREVQLEAREHEGRTIHALPEDGYQAVIDHVDSEYGEDSYGRVHPVRYTVRALLATAMRSAELAHLSRDWMVTYDGEPTLEIQHRDCECSYCEKQAHRNVKRRDDAPDPGEGGFDEALRKELGSMWHPKSSSGNRRVTVYDDEAWSVMNRYLDEHGDDVVHPNTLWQRVKKVDEAFDFEKPLTPHRLRHSAATRMHRKGVSVEDISSELGHASLETTEIYIQEPYALRSSRVREKMGGGE